MIKIHLEFYLTIEDNYKKMKLSELNTGEKGVIVKVRGHSGFRRRVTEMGFVRGKEVRVVRSAPLKDPVEYEIMGYDVSLRRTEADMIEVVTMEEALNLDVNVSNGSFSEEEVLQNTAQLKRRSINVAFIGNPNAGKTTLFNQLSHSNEKVGNYGGVTVDIKKATTKFEGYNFTFYDLPGTYSLSAYSHEEIFVRNFIFENTPDIIINVLDASNLERNMYLTTQLIDMHVPVVIALNMFDELEKKGAKLNREHLGNMLGIPIIPTIGSKGKGLDDLLQKAIDVYEDKDDQVRLIHINYGAEIEKAIDRVKLKIKGNKHLTTTRSARYIAIKLLERDKHVQNVVKDAQNANEILITAQVESKRIEKIYNDKPDAVFTDAKYGFVAGALKETYSESPVRRRRKTEIIDTFLTHKIFGFPVFFAFMFFMFYITFNVGQYPMEWIENLFGWLNTTSHELLPKGSFRHLLTDGIISGLGAVLVFLPNILILFFFISLMEDTGYMARAAFIMDKIMHRIGLHGKSFIPLLMGFGCNVPAILATRILENKQDRLLTILINPFMSCSARLPVYILIIGAFFPQYPTLILMGIYMFGILLAVLSSLIFKKILFKQPSAPFVMELPPYRVPTLRVILRHMWDKAAEYIKKVGGTILIAVILIWALMFYPQNSEINEQREVRIQQVENTPELNESQKAHQISEIERNFEKTHMEQSYLYQIGSGLEPVFKPIGLDWKMGVSIVTGIAAKEIVVSTLAVIYQTDDETDASLISKLREEREKKNETKGLFNLRAISFLLFVLIYFPCVGVVAAVKKETGSWKWPIFMVVYTTSLAWFLSFFVFQIGKLLIGA
jgi:ferrous iron transport protein B